MEEIEMVSGIMNGEVFGFYFIKMCKISELLLYALANLRTFLNTWEMAYREEFFYWNVI